MHKLTSSNLAELEQKLRAMRVDALDAVRMRLAGSDNGMARSLGSLLEQGDAAVDAMLADDDIALVQHELATLRDIDAALKRIEFDVGGICTQCGASIPIERLRAVPTAATCVGCAALAS